VKALLEASLRSDRGGRFDQEIFIEYWEKHGISHNVSALRIPEQMD